MRILVVLFVFAVFVLSTSCTRVDQHVPVPQATATASPTPAVHWSDDPTESVINNEALRIAWKEFEKSQQYRLAKPSDRMLTREASAHSGSNPAAPSLVWWGTHGYRGFVGKNFLVAIVVDPARTDPNRYALVVLAAVVSQGKQYKTYWVAREQDMQSYLISASSGTVFVDCFRTDGSQENKTLTWDGKSRQFQLLPI